jgi:hypothetical protein
MAQPRKKIKIEPSQDNANRSIDAGSSQAFAWQLCSGQDEATRIAIKEQALDLAKEFSSTLCDVLKAHIHEHSSLRNDTLKHWVSDIGL